MSIQEQVVEIREKAATEAIEKIDAPNMSEVILGYKDVEIPELGTVRIHRPDHFINDKADKIASAVQLALIQDEDNVLPLEDQLRLLLEKRGVWSDEHDERMYWFRDRVSMIAQEELFELKNKRPPNIGSWIESSDEEANSIFKSFLSAEMSGQGEQEAYDKYKELRADRIVKYRSEFLSLRGKYNRYFSGTIETFAWSEKQIFFLQQLCTKVDGSLYWATTDDFKKEKPTIVNAVATAASKYWNGQDNEVAEHFFDSLQEDLT